MNPIAFSIFSFDITWYGISYFISFVSINHFTVRKLSSKYPEKQIEQIMSFSFFGMIVGGRLGYVILYDFQNLLNFKEIIAVWNGGMAAYGGFIGGITFLYIRSKILKVKINDILNAISLYIPIALFFGRIANHINNEIPGRELFGMYHHVILYSIFLEGMFLFILINFKNYFSILQKISESNLFFISYGSIRIFLDFFRATESSMFYYFTYGQLFGSIMIVIGLLRSIKLCTYRLN
ncbi:prolipoprotein diacylglyceryl transferase [Candidatus Cytomitobacter indipagum]|uniref:Prolipoprotein diacylglyceryl transferase n=1 Tax=Candidatus Cytomitobacter indipagum TaxID=2601575 RepID=A0A5C0UDH4_9PROT|nr:prolipoprotein diacylglyceryl transferase [Candidatus Cytomitobacter indipagum]QEK38086.1 prolipoprotein diacylglyceryl transferase [Candidatus Cytomitobacter indipagum]